MYDGYTPAEKAVLSPCRAWKDTWQLGADGTWKLIDLKMDS